MTNGVREFTVVLAHGPGDAAEAAAVVEELRARRQTVIPVVIEGSDAPLLEACAKLGGRGLFVIARGQACGADRAESLREVLRDLGTPMSRSLVLGLDAAGGARSFVDRVLTVLGRITGGTTETRAPLGPPRPPPLRPRPAEPTAASYAVVPPSFDAPVETPVPATRPENHSTVIAVDSPSIIAVLPRRRIAAGVTALAAAGMLGWLVASRPEPVAATPHEVAAEIPTPPAPPIAESLPPTPTSVAMAPAEATAPAVEDSEPIVTALKKREIRALDVFVVAPEAKKPADFAGASAYCASLNVAGIGDWRLPDIGELLSMSRAKMVRKGSFWSATKGDTFGDLRLVLVIKRDRISAIPSGWDGGRVICVRERS
jgi:hypothetical protein